MKRIFAASGWVPLRQAETFKGDTKHTKSEAHLNTAPLGVLGALVIFVKARMDVFKTS